MDDKLMRRYRGRVMFGPFTGVHPDELRALEGEIGRLPDDYRAFIGLANGGRLEYDIRVPPGDAGEVVGFTELYQVGRDQRGEYGYSTLLGQCRRRKDWWLAEHISMEWLLPIAGSGGNDTLFLDLGPENTGRLVAFVQGLPRWTGLRERTVLATVADTFDEYVDALFIDDETAQMNWEDVQHAAPDDPWRRVVEQWLDEGLTDWRARSWATDR
ncbi:SMI1/KNR4 family protein [Amycolatopsis sp. EV170708-02-1]|uniref:SMI1/KNR4 family protein n=1 Tax=Amycolatopsis sp. EV170708-02-1 TaxID=2919322 RepID=UPI001F0B8C80|nr:SMI1/KNR4 family protein [Amycolatopsis sp. EV170708-02-1]UMP05394.1 SMI1/KNR4 family protein [Amycolatopsis sp. EV170708-02-1]